MDDHGGAFGSELSGNRFAYSFAAAAGDERLLGFQFEIHFENPSALASQV